MEIRNKMNRHKIKTWSITFPQSGDMEREEFVDMFPPCASVICCQETHQDGGYHLHMGIKLVKGLTKKGLLYWIQEKFPDDYKRIDVQATRSLGKWRLYVMKEDPNVYEQNNEEDANTRRLRNIYRNNIDAGQWRTLTELIPFEEWRQGWLQNESANRR